MIPFPKDAPLRGSRAGFPFPLRAPTGPQMHLETLTWIPMGNLTSTGCSFPEDQVWGFGKLRLFSSGRSQNRRWMLRPESCTGV